MTGRNWHATRPMAAARSWWQFGLVLAAGALCAGCAGLAAPGPTPGSVSEVASIALDPILVRQISADAQWLGKNKLPAPPPALLPAPTCPESQISDRGKRQFRIPATLATILVSYNARPWAFVRYDLTKDGTPTNLQVAKSAGLKSFDRAALDTVAAWRFNLSDQLAGAQGCVALVSVT